jgi:hypothetical protein
MKAKGLAPTPTPAQADKENGKSNTRVTRSGAGSAK